MSLKGIYKKLKKYYPKYSLWEVAEFNPLFVIWYLKEFPTEYTEEEKVKLIEKAEQNLNKRWEILCM